MNQNDKATPSVTTTVRGGIVRSILRLPFMVLLSLICLVGLIVVALGATWIATYDYQAIDLRGRLIPPFWAEGGNPKHFLGTDDLGRDMLSRLIFSVRMSLFVALLGTVITHMVGKDLGFSGQQANVFFLAMVPFSLLGKVVIGRLADVAPMKPAIGLVVLANILVWGLFYSEPSYGFFVVTGAIFGIGIGGAMPLQGVALGRCFGRENFGRASGLGGLVAIPVIAAASAVSQLLQGATGSFQASFLVQIGLLAFGGGLLAIVRIPASEGAPD